LTICLEKDAAGGDVPRQSGYWPAGDIEHGGQFDWKSNRTANILDINRFRPGDVEREVGF
jgi:hypothetical protein